MRHINGNTTVYGIIGSPVRHTLSPIMYNPLFQRHGRNAVYLTYEVEAEGLSDAIKGMRALGIRGFHITCPHKESVLPLLDRVSREGRAIGAVNIILNNEGVLYGANTDGRGYLRALQNELDFDAEGKTIALLGAGGASRAIVFALARVGVRRVYIFNRTLPRAERMAGDLQGRFPNLTVEVHPLMPERFLALSPDFDLLINATIPKPDNPVDDLPIDGISPGCICSDINYHRRSIPWLQRARAAGLTIQRGMGMLIYQGALSMQILTGLSVKASELEDFIDRHLSKTEGRWEQEGVEVGSARMDVCPTIR